MIMIETLGELIGCLLHGGMDRNDRRRLAIAPLISRRGLNKPVRDVKVKHLASIRGYSREN